MKKLNLLIICFLGLSIFSCSTENLSDDDSNDGNNGNPNNIDTPKLLSRVEFQSTGEIYTNADLNIYYRPDGTLHKAGGHRAFGVNSEYHKYFYYNEQILRIEHIGSYPGHDILDQPVSGRYTEFTYEDDKIVQIKYFYNNSESAKLQLNYDNNKLNSVESFGYDEYWNYSSLSTYQYDNNSNIISEFYSGPDSLGLPTNLDFAYSYDNKINPFKNIAGNVSLLEFLPTMFGGANNYLHSGHNIFNQNNVLTSTRYLEDGTLLQSNTSYTYDEEGFPLTATTTNNVNSNNLKYKYFYYKNNCSDDLDPDSGGGFFEVDASLGFHLKYEDATNIDLDLYVRTPWGTVMFYANPQSKLGHFYSLGRQEVIYWPSNYPNPPSGNYEYWVQYFGNCDNPISTDFTLEVMKEGVIVETQTGSIKNGASEVWSYQYQ